MTTSEKYIENNLNVKPIKYRKNIFIILFLILTTLVLFPVKKAKASTQDLYKFSWLDVDKEVFVLQNRKFYKDKKFYTDLSGGITTSGAFVNSQNLQARVGFFFLEEMGIEGVFSKNFGSENNTAQDVRNKGGPGSVPFRRIVDSYTGVLFLWSPFYSKLNSFNKIFYMDWMLGLGYAQVTETNNKPEFVNSALNPLFSTEKHSALMWQISLKVYLSQNWEVRSNLSVLHYQAQKASSTANAIYSNFDMDFGIGYIF